ncbi:MAG: hypothetical protein R3F30_01120 [Planctomycetota bacterium]
MDRRTMCGSRAEARRFRWDALLEGDHKPRGHDDVEVEPVPDPVMHPRALRAPWRQQA